ncbi:hypothetical protein [Halorubrum luteum]
MNRSAADDAGIAARVAGSLADASLLPTSIRAVLDYYATTGDLPLDAVRLQRRVDAFVESVIADAFDDVERAIAETTGGDSDAVSFSYDTKLTMPAELTLGHVYQRARSDGSTPVERAEAVTELVVVALLDGDMRDAINDAEFEDFLIEGVAVEREHAAEIAQKALRSHVEELFDQFPEAVRDAYREAVDRSEAHQDRDPYFRELMADARDGDDDALDAIREEYKHGAFADPNGDGASDGPGDAESVIRPADLFVDEERSFPYLKTQYGRVGVIYDGMIEMYRAAGVDVEDTFKRSIVFTIIGAQIWLDDIDDYADDLADVQLTPVTAEYLLADADYEAYRNVVEATNEYLGAAERYAAETDSPLAGIGANYVFYSGDPSVLPGHDRK